MKFKTFFITFIGMVILHSLEDSIWILSSRYTSVPIYVLYLGVIIWALIATIWANRGKNE